MLKNRKQRFISTGTEVDIMEGPGKGKRLDEYIDEKRKETLQEDAKPTSPESPKKEPKSAK